MRDEMTTVAMAQESEERVQRLLARAKRRMNRNLPVMRRADVVERMDARPKMSTAALVEAKRNDLVALYAAFDRFSTNTGYLPAELRRRVDTFEATMMANRKDLQRWFDEALESAGQ